MNRKVNVAYNFKCCLKVKNFSRSHWVTYTEQKWQYLRNGAR